MIITFVILPWQHFPLFPCPYWPCGRHTYTFPVTVVDPNRGHIWASSDIFTVCVCMLVFVCVCLRVCLCSGLPETRGDGHKELLSCRDQADRGEIYRDSGVHREGTFIYSI